MSDHCATFSYWGRTGCCAWNIKRKDRKKIDKHDDDDDDDNDDDYVDDYDDDDYDDDDTMIYRWEINY